MGETLTEKVMHREGTVNIGSLTLESGKVIDDVSLRYERSGDPSLPVILICHALTGTHQSVGTEQDPGWWRGFAGEHAYIDLTKFQVITFNVLGGCSGSTGPDSLNQNGEKYRTAFPFITVKDMVNAQYHACLKLGITSLHGVIGGSLGGMQTLEWCISYPDFMGKAVLLAATPSLSDYGIAFNRIGIHAIENDPAWNNGLYENASDVKGFEVARMVGLVTYRSPYLFTGRFNREEKEVEEKQPFYQVESYLKYQGEKITKRFDPNSYLTLLYAMNHHDISRYHGSIQEAAGKIKSKLLGIGFKGDLLYPPNVIEQFISYVPEADFHEVDTDFGHDGFLVEFEKWGELVKYHFETGQ
ncbi:homoserine O-acetyltransferase MetX [Jeotgalibacillus haloalkalitolerans]|uniref:Homoserine O-acetyltransferase n=1 Tax=Jeotgalibacillus haloalkalitolerans TaxID=3104292 RepID=A0ABU5KPS3_9BACL|nr:homoserine O-acetyltransferase [Jeotgalibacillus sp. HH7-29]MDZ5713255.1 homoserine O-acetyltransferase [Jeotgalibacillus sp. HH7-29]